MLKVDVKQDLKALNNKIASENREKFAAHGVCAINIIGSPGSGKTTLLENILPRLGSEVATAVIEGDLATENDAARIRKTGVKAIQINTGGGCHLDARMIENQLSQLELDALDLVIIENVGNLVCPSGYDLGEDMRMVVLSVAEGEDKPAKYPVAFLNADTAVLTKTDLLPYIDADAKKMRQYISDINPKTLVFEAGKADGVYRADELTAYILAQVKKKAGK
jgi:hydrogenase nickel incorporation protein HypB